MNKLALIAGVACVTVAAIMSFKLTDEKPVYQSGNVKVYAMKDSEDFPRAELRLLSPEGGSTLKEGKDTFKFRVSNYELGAQTPDADQKMCANSAKGQHIHFIMDNAPYYASYTEDIAWEMKPGHHVLLAFLSRSYHESLKHKNAYILKEFKVGQAKDNFDETAPHLFYSRPKGEYIGEKEVKKLMIDFYLVNCTLSEKGYKVKAVVNGHEFLITKWQPYVVEGLPLGEVKVKLTLLDGKNNPVKSPFNGVERTSVLKTEPFKK